MSFEERLKSIQAQISANEAAEKAALSLGNTGEAEKIAQAGKPLRRERAGLKIVVMPIDKEKQKGKA